MHRLLHKLKEKKRDQCVVLQEVSRPYRHRDTQGLDLMLAAPPRRLRGSLRKSPVKVRMCLTAPALLLLHTPRHDGRATMVKGLKYVSRLQRLAP